MMLNTDIYFYSGLILMILYVIFFKAKKGRLLIDHIVLLFFGFSYYVYFPLFLFSRNIFYDSAQKEAYNALDHLDIKRFLIIFMGLIVTVIIADFFSKDIRLKPTRFGIPDFKLMKIIFFLFAIWTIPSVYYLWPSIMTSYDSSKWVIRGPFISFIVILITMSSIYLSRYNKLKLLNLFTITAFVYTFYNLLSGNRGYFVSLIVSVVVVASQLRNGIRYRNIIFFVITGIIITGSVGSLRSSGESEIHILYQLQQEGANVAIPLLRYLTKATVDLVESPIYFLSQTINMIPSVIFPSKFDYILINPRSENFLAATHFYVTAMINFGYVGTFLFIYLFVHFLNVIKVKYRLVGIYPALCAHIPFMFFRDFELTIIKYMFEYTFLFAVVIMLYYNTYNKMIKDNIIMRT